jgi:hypothetical protein
MSHMCGTDGRSALQETDRQGDLRARAQELLSPVGGTALSARNVMSLKDSVSLCNGVGGAVPLLSGDDSDGRIRYWAGWPLTGEVVT